MVWVRWCWVAMVGVAACASEPVETPVRVDLDRGTLLGPPGWVVAESGGTDSVMGRVERDGEVVLTYDIGGMAGTRVYAALQPECEWFDAHVTPSGRSRLACVRDGVLTATWIARRQASPSFPANFRVPVATGHGRDHALAVVDSYQPTSETVPLEVAIPRRMGSGADGRGGLWMQLDPSESSLVTVHVSVDCDVGYRVDWREGGSAEVWSKGEVAALDGAALRGPTPTDPVYEADVVVFETQVPVAYPWSAQERGYRELHRSTVRGTYPP